jgi:hypothetical protein
MGYLRILNLNCEVNNPLSVECLMRHTTIAYCVWTYSQLGWSDWNLNGQLDPLDPPI